MYTHVLIHKHPITHKHTHRLTHTLAHCQLARWPKKCNGKTSEKQLVEENLQHF